MSTIKWLSNSLPHIKALGTKFDLAVKQIKVNLESSVEQTMMGPRPQCYISSHNGPLVLEKKIFEGFVFFPIYGRGSHLGRVTQIARTNFRSPDPWRLHMKFGFDWPSGFGEDLWKWCTDGRTDDGAWLYYKLTNEPKGSGELKNKSYRQDKRTNAREAYRPALSSPSEVITTLNMTERNLSKTQHDVMKQKFHRTTALERSVA